MSSPAPATTEEGSAAGIRERLRTRLHDLSLTARLVTVVVLLVLAAYAVTTTLTATLLRDYLTDRTDAELRAYIEPLGRMAYADLRGGEGSGETVPPNAYYVAITPREDSDALYVWTTPAQVQAQPDLGRIEWDDGRVEQGPFTVSSVESSTEWRVLVRRMSTGEGTLAVALPLTSVDNTVHQLWVLTGLVGGSTLVAVALLGWVGVRRAFRPLSRIEDTAAAIAAGDLARRIPQRGGRDEVASLSNSLNRMLAHVEASFAVREASEERMRTFVADASHELRTPLATVRGYAELYRVGGVREPDDVAQAMRRIEDEARRMSRLVEDLLLLTRLDSGPSVDRAPVDLTVLAADIVQDARVRAPDRRITLTRVEGTDDRQGPVVTTGDDNALRQLLTNLVANALSHTPDGTPVEVALGRADGWCLVEVRDHGEGIDEGAAARVFERFFRADPSRSRARGGTGLGLPIVAAIVGQHGGSVRHRPTPGGGATFAVSLPARQGAAEE
ncbi:sensor histidine kinase [Ornithinicoccus halotolerans]|uniref:sensor histidine kinase n=1 Tax=Ornithinicoccus halotolerans TaxID=1748220 RepID=UPI001295809A|nr:HAMP domain-containing sensor histidine kinase [Ornithinicoccus halotolerans]